MDGFFLEITGSELTDSENAKVKELAEETGAKLAAIYDGNEKLHIHVKTHNEEGTRKKFSMKASFDTKVGVFHTESVEWDIGLCAGECLSKLERVVVEDHKKKVDKRQKN